MVDTVIFETTAEVERKAGAKVSSVSKAEAYVDDYMTQAESLINTLCKFNFSDSYAGLNTDVKGILKEVSSNIAAIYAISYDMSGFTTNIQAEDMINILRDAALRGLSVLRDRKGQDFMAAA